jgi:glycosyltransferase involved in cell wall biosynthesis
MNSKPLVSIVLPTYNGEKYLADAIESVRAQTWSNWELIVVDDNSSDETPAIIKRFCEKDERVRVVRHDVNRRLPGALNSGFRKSRGELLTWTSDDNVYEPDALELLACHLAELPQVDFVYSDIKIIDEDGACLDVRRMDDPTALTRRNCVGACFMYRRGVYEAVGEYRDDMFLVEDYEFWLRVASKCKMAYVPGPSPYRYRWHAESLSNTKAAKVLLQTAKVQAMYAPSHAAAKVILADGYFLALWKYRAEGEMSAALNCAWQHLCLRPFSPRAWRACVTGVLRTVA